MATTARNRRLEPSYKQHSVVDDERGVVLDVEVTTGELNEGQIVESRIDATMDTTGVPITIATADAGYAYAKVYGALERRGIEAVIPPKAEPIRSPVPLRRFRYDAKNDIVKCPRGKTLLPQRPVKHGRFFYAKARDCGRCDLAALCLSKGRVNKAIVIGHDYPALLRARRRRERWSEDDRRLYRRHRWRSEGFHGEAKTWHGLARAVRRGLENMRIQALLTAAAINLKRLAAALLAALIAWWLSLPARRHARASRLPDPRRVPPTIEANLAAPSERGFFNSPRVHWLPQCPGLCPKGQQRSAGGRCVHRQAFAQNDAREAAQTLAAGRRPAPADAGRSSPRSWTTASTTCWPTWPSRRRTAPSCTRSTRSSASTARSSGAPMSSASFPTRPRSPAWSAPCCSSRTTSGRSSAPAT